MSIASPAAALDAPTRALIVDDDPDLRELISQFLSNNGFVVHTASQARDMDKLLARGDIDVIVLDYMMPGEDGLSVCKRLNEAGGPPVISSNLCLALRLCDLIGATPPDSSDWRARLTQTLSSEGSR